MLTLQFITVPATAPLTASNIMVMLVHLSHCLLCIWMLTEHSDFPNIHSNDYSQLVYMLKPCNNVLLHLRPIAYRALG